VPAGTSRSMPSRTVLPPKALRSCETSIAELMGATIVGGPVTALTRP
jgi:hypothetical protein